MRYEDQVIDQVQSANDIVEIISQVLTLKKSGRNLKACCPFHSEKTPSFMVQPEKQIFHCFGCGAGGDVFGFIMRHENLSFPEAVRQLAERAGIRLPEKTSEKREGPSQSEQIYEIYRLAADFYHAQFLDPVKGREAQEYFLSRGFSPEMAKELKIGWAPEAWRTIFDYLSKKGFSNSLLQLSALVLPSQKGSGFYDTFRNRLLFPIHNLHGKVVAFGGRVIGEGSPKYLNSPENPVFYKRRELFGLHLAKKFIDREQPRLLVVEGYFDFLGLYQAGFKATVATLGTSLTEDHVRVLKRFADEAIVVYDGDKAGEAAALRGLEVFLEGGMSVRVARLPAGYDPDDFVRKEGPEAFQKLLDEARDFFDYKLEVLLSRYNKRDTLGLMRLTGDFLETFSKIPNAVLVDRYVKRLASSLGVEEHSLKVELEKLKKKTEKNAAVTPAPAASPAPSKPEEEEEILLLAIMVEEKPLRETAVSQLQETDFTTAPARMLFDILKNAGNQSLTWPQILNRLSHEPLKQKLVSALDFEWNSEEKEKAFGDCLKKIQRKRVDRRLEELRRSIAQAEKEGNQAGMAAFVQEFQTLWRQSGTS